MTEFGQVLAHSKEALHCGFVSWKWHFSDVSHFSRIGLHPSMDKLVPHESDRWGFKLIFFFLRELWIVFSKIIQELHQVSVVVNVSVFVSPYPYTQISSAMLITPRRPSKNSCCRRWYSSGPETSPNGMRL